MKNILIVTIIMTFMGCTATTKIKDYDSDKISYEEQQRMLKEGGVEYTDDTVVLAENKDVYVTNVKVTPIVTFEKDYEIKQDKWKVVLYNSSDIDYCVGVVWKLMDYKFISEYPGLIYMKSNSQRIIGDMIQMVWEINGVKFTPPGSGYVHELVVNELDEETDYSKLDDMDKCINLEKEENIVEK